MSTISSCNENFLDGVASISLYPVETSKIGTPFSVPQITSLSGCTFPAATVEFSVSEKDGAFLADSLTAKTSFTNSANGMVYTYELSATVTDSAHELRELYAKINGGEYYAVVQTFAGELLLCFTLPGTFLMTMPANLSQSETQTSVTIQLKAMSDFILISTN